jgi:predicted N-formylglutamate amidohydrolase
MTTKANLQATVDRINRITGSPGEPYTLHTHTPMTYTEHEAFDKVERTCDEIRKDNINLQNDIFALHQDLSQIATLNTLGKTKQIADIINNIQSR